MATTVSPQASSSDAAQASEPPGQRPRRRPRIAAAIVVAALLIAGGGSGAWKAFGPDDAAESAAGMPVFEDRVVEVSTGTVGESVTAQGTVANAETADLSFEVAGTVETVTVTAGDQVKAGQVLATLNSAALEAALADAEAQLAEAGAALDDAQDSDADDTAIDAAEAAVVTAQDAVDSATEDLAGIWLVADFDGLVAAVDLTVGEQLGSSGTAGTSMTGTGSGSGRSASTSSSATSGTGQQGGGTSGSTTSSDPQIQLISQGRFDVELAVAAADIADVVVGQDVDLSISTTASGSSESSSGGFGPPGMQGGGPPGMQGGNSSTAASSGSSEEIDVTGAVTSVGRVADASSGVATYSVTVAFSDDTGEIWAGSTATADIHVSDRNDVTLVESMAVSTDNGTSTVTVAVDGTLDGATEERTVTTGETSGNMIEIVDGLVPGEQVIVAAPSFGGPGGGSPPGMGSGGSGAGGSGGQMPGAADGESGSADVSVEAGS